MKRVFVYGTLMRGGRYHHLIAHCRFVGKARAAGYALFDLGPYPAMVEGSGSVSGELYDVDAGTLLSLDELEGAPSYFRRDTLTLEGGGEALGYVFVDASSLESPIPSGDWRLR